MLHWQIYGVDDTIDGERSETLIKYFFFLIYPLKPNSVAPALPS